jgi:hypothetical protein
MCNMKKINTIYKISLAVFLVGSLASCKKYLEEAYIDPNRPTSPNVQTAWGPIANNWTRGVFFDSRYIGPYVQNFVNSGVNSVWDRMGWDQNITNGTAGGEVWRQHYWAIGSTLRYIIEEGKKTENWDYVGAAYAMFAYSWQTAADQYGELIVSQAFDNTRLTFNFESQSLAYSLVFQYCDSAAKYLQMTGIKVTPTSLLPGDAWMYNGSQSRWLKFAYGVKARNFHRFSKKSSGYAADSVIRYVDLAFSNATDDAMFKFAGGISDQSNFYGQLRANLATFRQSQFIVGLLNGDVGTPFSGVADPRRGTLIWPSQDGVYRGVSPVTGENTSVAATARVPNPYGVIAGAIPTQDTGRFIYRNTAPMPILTYAELQFLKAEAAFIKGDGALALEAYKNGINGHFDMIEQNFPATTADGSAKRHTPAMRIAYITNPLVVPASSASLTLPMIMNQKYIALYFHGFGETWVDMRRHNYSTSVYPSLVVPSGANLFPDNNNKLVNRLRPRMQVEFQWNAESLRTIGGLEIDYHTKPVWFQIP